MIDNNDVLRGNSTGTYTHQIKQQQQPPPSPTIICNIVLQHQYNVVKKEVMVGVQRNADHLFRRLQFLSQLFTSSSVSNNTSSSIKQMTVMDFEDYALPVSQEFHLPLIVFAPWLTTELEKLEWEVYSRDQQEWIAHGRAIRKQAGVVTDHNNSTKDTNGAASSVVEFTEEMDIVDQVWQFNPDGMATPSDEGPPYAPMWIGSPPPSMKSTDSNLWVNFNLNVDPSYRDSAQLLATHQASEPPLAFLSKPLDWDRVLGRVTQIYPKVEGPHSLGILPVCSPSKSPLGLEEEGDEDGSAVIGHLSAAIPWVSLLSNVGSLFCVV